MKKSKVDELYGNVQRALAYFSTGMVVIMTMVTVLYIPGMLEFFAYLGLSALFGGMFALLYEPYREYAQEE